MCGVTGGAISHRYMTTRLGDAIVDGKIDITHPNAAAYMGERSIRDEKKMKAAAKVYQPELPRKQILPIPSPAPTAGSVPVLDENLRQMVDLGFSETPPLEVSEVEKKFDFSKIENMTLKEIVDYYGSIAAFQRITTAQKSFTEYQTKDLKLMESRGDLIEREFIDSFVFDLLKLLFKRLTYDTPIAIYHNIIDIINDNKDNLEDEIIRASRESNLTAIKICVNSMKKNLRDMKMKTPELNV